MKPRGGSNPQFPASHPCVLTTGPRTLSVYVTTNFIYKPKTSFGMLYVIAQRTAHSRDFRDPVDCQSTPYQLVFVRFE